MPTQGDYYRDLLPFREFGTERQRAALDAVIEHGSLRAAARALDTVVSNVHQHLDSLKKKAAKQGWSPDHDMTRTVPDGFHVKGVSTYYDRDGTVRGQWVKSSIDHERQRQLFQEALETLARDLPRVPPIAAPRQSNDDLLVVYPVGDHHVGMLAHGVSHGGDAGDNYDVEISSRLLCGAFDHLTKAAPPARQALVVLAGDFLHYDSALAPVTPTNNNPLDADGRFKKMVSAAMIMVRHAIDAALRAHSRVHVIVEIGNHDLTGSIFLAEALKHLYERNERVFVDDSPAHFHYFKFGAVLIGSHHGHGPKPQDLPAIMAHDQPKAWGATRHRHWIVGHVHHRFKLANDFTGVHVEALRILGPTDAWAHNRGYRSIRDMQSIVFHREHGEVSRNVVRPEMLAFSQ